MRFVIEGLDRHATPSLGVRHWHRARRGSHTYEKSAWFYVEKDTGVVNASDLVFTHSRACPESLWWQKNMRGSIEFVASELIVQIEMPRYADSTSTPTHHVAWEHNGRYRIERSLEPAAPLDPGGCGI